MPRLVASEVLPGAMSFGRVIAQVLMVGAGIVSKAFMQAYAQAKQGGGAAARTAAQAGRMPSDQAREVLQVARGPLRRDEIMAQFAKYYEANDPDKCVYQLHSWSPRALPLLLYRARCAASRSHM